MRGVPIATEMAGKAGLARSSNMNPQEDRLLPARKVEARYSVSDMTLWRWLRSDMGFPKPYYIGRYRYWREAELLDWENARPRMAPGLMPAPTVQALAQGGQL
jgi:predicted DNA-binding transcriptional regulator AlpA